MAYNIVLKLYLSFWAEIRKVNAIVDVWSSRPPLHPLRIFFDIVKIIFALNRYSNYRTSSLKDVWYIFTCIIWFFLIRFFLKVFFHFYFCIFAFNIYNKHIVTNVSVKIKKSMILFKAYRKYFNEFNACESNEELSKFRF